MSFWTLLTGGDRKVKKHGLPGTAGVLSCGNTGIRMRGTRRIDPKDRTNIVIMRRTSDVAGILANGIPGTATVLRQEEVSGVSPRTSYPLEGLVLEVAELPVRILANDATGIAIDFDRLE